jgi:anti-sigma factor RsiW
MTAWNAPIGEDDLQAYVDGRLDPARAAVVTSWLGEHPDAAARVAAERIQREELRARLQAKANEPVPTRLRIANVRAARQRRLARAGLRAAAALLLFLAGATGGWELRGLTGRAEGETALLTTDALAAHRTFVVEVRHPVEVDAGQEAHLIQWLSRRLGRELVAPDLAGLGYRLIGGRLLPAESGPAAQLMYEGRGGQRLTLYLRTEKGEDRTAFRFVESGSVGAFYWIDNGFGYAVAATADRQTLLSVAERVYDQTEGRTRR